MEHPILAIDYGQARIGLAATDPIGIAAHPIETIEVARTNPFQRIATIVAERGVKQIIVGLPLRLDGREGTSADRVRAFVVDLQESVPDVPLEFADERLSTTAASEKLRKAGKSARQQKGIIDQAAALEILNDWLQEQPEPPL